MKHNLILLGSVLIILNNNIHCQDIMKDLNHLPRTMEVAAPEFNTEQEYFFNIDSGLRNLFIQDLRISDSDKIHFYQWLYELPLNDLKAESFTLEKDPDDTNEFYLNIAVVNNEKTLLKYMFQDNKVSSIFCGSKIRLGPWAYSDSLYKKFEEITSKLISQLPVSPSSNTVICNSRDEIKYVAKNVRTINPIFSLDSTIGNGFQFRQFVQEDYSLLSNRFYKSIVETIKDRKIEIMYPTPVIIYATESTNRTIVLVHNGIDEILELIDVDIKILQNTSIPTKYVFLLK